MKRKIGFQFISLIFTAIIIFIVGATLIARNSLNNATELNLKNYLEIVEKDYNLGLDETEIIDKYSSLDNYLRITIIDSAGVVLADSIAEDLENHLDRPEINNLGKVYIRNSDTLNIDMMYLATQAEDDNYIRVAIPRESILMFLNDFIGFSIIIGVIIATISVLISHILIKKSLKPLIDMKDTLTKVNEGKYQEIIPIEKYDEINALIKEINKINKSISENIISLKSEKQKTDFLLNHMEQGICVLDEEGRIILLNQFLRNLYNFNIDININKDYRFLLRDKEIQQAIKKALDSKTNSNLVIEVKDEYFSVSINYLDKDWQNKSSVILLYTNITAIKNIEILKRDFFINASHELKSPLTAIMGSSDIIAQGMAKDPDTIIDLANRISEETKRMNNLVMDMLALSKYENNQTQNKNQIVAIKKLITEIKNNLKLQANKNKIKIIDNTNDIKIIANYDEIYQLLKNLIENSIKYGKENGSVQINSNINSNYLMFEVKDDGIGIPNIDQTRIFERFYRVDKARSKAIGGTGLGLSIVKHIVINYNGYIEIDSQENVGTSIRVFFPKSMIQKVGK